MSLTRQLRRGLYALFHRSAAHDEIGDEIDHYLAEAAAAYESQGLTHEQAMHAARVDLGSPASVAQQVRATHWERLVETALADLRHAVRRLIHDPGFTLASTLTLALGIAASTAIFSTIKPILLDALPYPAADRLIVVTDSEHGAPLDVTFGAYRELAGRSRSFSALAVMRPWQPTISGDGDPERLEGQQVSSGYFSVLGIAPARGRAFAAADDVPGAPPVVILSDGLWRRRFGGDSNVLGSPITFNDESRIVVGIMPPGFENVLSPSASAWAPLGYDPALPATGKEWGHHLQMVGRMREQVSLRALRTELSSIARTPIAAFVRPAHASLRDGLLTSPLRDEITRGVSRSLWAVMAASVVLLLIACVNVVNLTLARASERRVEWSTCLALGASRVRLISQLLAEALLIATAGGAAALALAYALVGAIVRLAPATVPRLHAIRVDTSAFAFAAVVSLGVATIVAVIAGLSALRAGRPHQQPSFRIVTGRRTGRSVIVAAEVALAVVLLVGAGLLLRTVQHLLGVQPGFHADGVLTQQIQTAGPSVRGNVATHAFFTRVLDAVKQVPGVDAAGLTSQLPLSGDHDLYGLRVQSGPPLRANEDPSALRHAVSAGYFETMGIAVRRGRVLDERDTANALPVAVVSASVARHRLASGDPIGQRIQIGAPSTPWFTVVGVADDVKHTSLSSAAVDAVYVPAAQWAFADRAMWLVVHTHGEPASLESAIRRAVWSVDRNQPINHVATMDDRLAVSSATERFVLTMFEVFALVALALAAIGIYGVLAASVVERTREIGLRSALGASRRMTVGLIAQQAASVTGLGLAAGVTIAAMVTRSLEALLFGVSPLDAATYAICVTLLIVTSAIACCLPAWRAVSIPPSIALQAN
jgi:putative ABC transport system permease protein